MDRESIGEFIGPMPVDEFLKEFANVAIPLNARRPTINADHFKSVPFSERPLKKETKRVHQPSPSDIDDVFSGGHEGSSGVPGGTEGHTDPEGDEEDKGAVNEFSYEEESEETPEQKSTRALERAMYQPLIECIRHFLSNFEIVDSSNKSDEQSAPGKKWRPDLLAYLKAIFATLNGKLTQFDKFSLAFEIKTNLSAKAFRDPSKDKEPSKTYTFTPDNENANLIRGQLMTVLAEQLSRQLLTHGFMVLINDPEARLIYVDRAAIVVTEAIPFRENPEPLLEFFWRFNFMTPAQRGIDQTVHFDRSNDVEVQQAAENLENAKRKQEKKGGQTTQQKKNDPIVVIDVPDPDPSVVRQVVSCGMMRYPGSVTGRGTRTYIVWDLKAKKPCFLKDTWRSLADGMEKESDIIRELTKEKVPNIPKLIAGDDLEGLNQTTRSQSFMEKEWVLSKPGKLDGRQHHRLLEDIIPKFVEQFSSARHMMSVMLDGLQAHEAAYVKCGILHRDISNNNIMINEKNRGVLTDWELAIHVRDVKTQKDIVTHARQRYRTGTWAFMSWRALSGLPHVHGLADDLESIFYVVLYLTLHHLDVDLRGKAIPPLIKDIFDEAKWEPNYRQYIGGIRKGYMLAMSELLAINVPQSQPVAIWIRNIAEALMGKPVPHPDVTSEEPQINNHNYMVALFKDIINSGDWDGEEEPKSLATRKPRTGKGHPLHAKRYQGSDDGGAYKGSDSKKQRKSASDHGVRARTGQPSQAGDAAASGSRG